MSDLIHPYSSTDLSKCASAPDLPAQPCKTSPLLSHYLYRILTWNGRERKHMSRFINRVRQLYILSDDKRRGHDLHALRYRVRNRVRHRWRADVHDHRKRRALVDVYTVRHALPVSSLWMCLINRLLPSQVLPCQTLASTTPINTAQMHVYHSGSSHCTSQSQACGLLSFAKRSRQLQPGE
jgi:hypothetical protein